MQKVMFLILFGLISICMNLQAKESVSKKKAVVSVPETSNEQKAKNSVSGVKTNGVVVSVPGMVCQMCVHGMRKAFKDSVNNAEKDVQVDLGKKTVTLNLATALSDEDIKKRVVQAGYKAVKIERL